MAGVDIVHVVYKGAPPAVVDLTSGQVEMMFAGPPASMPLVRSGRLRAVATTGSRRAAFLPEVPTVAESGLPGFESTIWTALLAPARTPATVIARVHREIADIARQPELRERLSADGLKPVGNPPRELADYISTEIARWSKVLKAIGLKVE